ncbi:alpha-2-macroglobulin [Rhizobacter sp. Root404]|uniref:alpha-2-macroglobulin family protein n=1 Tax=Rhizobacter sp. Root404 TaxID=1736528 RepID=UPI000701DDEB|nr:MG2 domain-containing protein [Rhizobacter sp. Root404]KQW35711.1 alpha-2-macroglobulin [Rhizobacter sp. Root404]
MRSVVEKFRAWPTTLAFLAALAAVPPAHAATIAAVTPQGEVAQVRQITVKFSEAVVAFGDLRLPDPMALACQGAVPAGAGRWANDRVWLYDFREPLPPGTRCTLKARSDWKPLNGALTGPAEYSFNTGGPAIVSMQPYDGSQIAEDQYFLLRLNGAAVESTVLANAWCEVEGIGERIGVTVIGGDARAALLKARGIDKKEQIERTLILTCKRPLPHAAAVRLTWGQGITGVANPKIATTIEQRYRFTVRPAFTAEFSCERENANAPCLPIRPMTVRFSAPVARETAAKLRLNPPSGGALAPVFDKDDKSTEVSAVTFPIPLPERAAFTIALPADLKDNAGRALDNASMFPLQVATGEAPPIAKFAAAPFGVIEAADPLLPVTVRHVQGDLRPAAPGGQVRIKHLQTDADILAWFATLRRYDESRISAKDAGLPESQWFTTETDTDARGRPIKRKAERFVATRELSLLNKDASAKRLDLPQLNGGDPRPFEVVGIPIAEPGYHVVEIESLRLGQSLLDKRAPMFVRTGVLVTNLGVHFKLGRENSLAWVTSLDRGKPVDGAEVVVNDCTGRKLWSGRTDANGLARISQALDADVAVCPAESGLFVTARKADAKGVVDTAFVFSSWQKGIESWRFNVPVGRGVEPDVRTATVFDRTLFRAGETVSMKHFARTETSAGLAALKPEDLPTRMKIVHAGTGQEFVQPLKWNGVRHALATWAIPPAAKLGVYNVVLVRESADAKRRREWISGDFRVEEFRLPLVDARLTGPKAVAVAPKELPIAAQLNYFSGGPMVQQPARASALLKSRSVAFAGYEEFSFEPPRDPAATPASRDEEDSETAPEARDGKLIADKLALTTDRNGAANFTLKDLPPTRRPSEVTAELTYNDPNGEVQTVATTIPLWPSAVVLGVKTGSWASGRGKARFSAVALDTQGQPIRNQAIEVRGRLSQVISTRKRMVGGFYAYDNRTEQKDLGALCSGQTDDRGLLACEAELDTAGQVELIASSKDAAGNAAQAAASLWVTKQGELWFAQDNDDRIDLLPEKKRYEPGETAKLQVRMPFREATALVAVEREGVLDTRVVTLRGDDPTVELKIEPSWGPNVYVSVLALRGRLREVPWYSLFTWGWKEPLNWWRAFRVEGRDYQAPTAMVDLAKPAFKLGVAALKIGLKAHELQVSVTTDKPQYSVRQKVVAKVRVAFGGKPLAGTSVAFAAVDEGLLALRPNDSWDLLNTMIKPRAWGVETSTAQSEIIGRRHYGRKAIAAGGGGGRGSTRELFDTLLLWKGDVLLDANGEATIEVPLNDSLTSFRLVAIADAGVQQFGTGSASIRVTQDLQLLAGLPPLVREGDQFGAMLTLRNTTAREMKVHATLQGTVNSGTAPDVVRTPLNVPAQDVVVPAGGAQELVWPVSVPADAFSVTWEAGADEQGAGPAAARARDRVKVTQLVAPAVPVRVLQATLQQLEGTLTLPIAAPADALPATGPKRGGILVATQPKLSGALPGMRRYFETYPFICLEQKTSKAVGLKDAKLWAAVAGALPTYLDSDGLASYFPPRAEDGPRGSDRLTAYVLAATHEAGFELPAPARDAMLAGLAAFVEGRIERSFWSPRADLDVRKIAAIEALSRYGRAQPKMLGSVNLTPNIWPTAAVIDWLRILRQLDGVPNAAKRIDEANQILRSRLTYAGTTLKFSNEQDDFWWWLMDSADANAARLILAVMDDPAWKEDIPRMVVGALSRQRAGAWLTTTANLWGSLALDKFSAKFESVKVGGRTAATLADRSGAIDWAKSPNGGSMLLAWPATPGPLNVAQDGTGKPWLTVQSLAAIPLRAPLRAGYSVVRSVSPVEQKDKAGWSRGDVVRVRIEVDAQSDMTWVVVSDPVPGGATILGSGLGRDSAIATRTERRAGSAWPAFDERGFEAFRSYFEFMPKGKHVIEYTVRLNNPGQFSLPPTRVEAMYAPESFGEAPNAALEVRP